MVDLIVAASGQKPLQLTLTLRDISAAGMSVMHNQRFEKGAKMILQLPKDDGTTLLAVYEVRRCVLAAPNLFLIGATLLEMKSSQQRKSA